jgi:predicted O-linked N-acetylglucosamine transferase (SPINDLY family)
MPKKSHLIQKSKVKTGFGSNFIINQNLTSKLQQAIYFHKTGKLEHAKVIYEDILSINPKHFDSLQLLGTIAAQMKDWEKSVKLLKQALTIDNTIPAVYNNLGVAYKELKLFDDALQNYNFAVSLKPTYSEAFYNRGLVLHELKRLAESLESYEMAISLKPNYAEAHSNSGNVYKELKQFTKALEFYGNALAINPNYVEAHLNCGIAFQELLRLEEALKSYEKVIRLDPNFPFIKGGIVHCKMRMNKWDSFFDDLESINSDVSNNKFSATPFGYQGICNSPKLLGKAASLFSLSKYPPRINQSAKVAKVANKKIKIGYLCGEFRHQATSILMVNLWEMHDKDKFELIGLDNGWDDGSPIRKRIEKAFDKFINISRMSDTEVVELVKYEAVDILINLNCFFGLSRNSVFSYKPAPVQVNYLGFPGTLGATYMDYIIADKYVIPEYSQDFYYEKVVYLPNCYQVNDRNRVIADKVFRREELGLPNDGFVFCCFNNNYKITPPIFDIWIRILKSVKGSVLWLLEDNPYSVVNLRKEAQSRGLEPSKLVFAKRMDLPEHLARHSAADLFLDTLPYNAHTTASDALWAGLPVLTCMGESFASRVAASLLNAIELPELITTSQEQYEAKAIELATNPEKLKAIREKLERNKLTTALFDSTRFTKHIETAYMQMYERYKSIQPADHIYITPQF